MSSSAIDFTKYEQQSQANPTIDFSQYEGHVVGPDLYTGEGMEQYGQQQAHKQAAVLPESKAGFLSSLGKTTGLTSGTDVASDLASQLEEIRQHPALEFMRGARQLLMAPVNLAYQAAHHPIDTATAITGGPEFAEGMQDKNPGEMAGAVVGGALNTAAVAKSAESLPELANNTGALLNKGGIDPVEAIRQSAEGTINKVSQSLGVSDPPPADLLTKAIKPGKANVGWDDAIQKALPNMKLAEQAYSGRGRCS